MIRKASQLIGLTTLALLLTCCIKPKNEDDRTDFTNNLAGTWECSYSSIWYNGVCTPDDWYYWKDITFHKDGTYTATGNMINSTGTWELFETPSLMLKVIIHPDAWGNALDDFNQSNRIEARFDSGMTYDENGSQDWDYDFSKLMIDTKNLTVWRDFSHESVVACDDANWRFKKN